MEWWFERFPAVGEDGAVRWLPSAFVVGYFILVNWLFFQERARERGSARESETETLGDSETAGKEGGSGGGAVPGGEMGEEGGRESD